MTRIKLTVRFSIDHIKLWEPVQSTSPSMHWERQSLSGLLCIEFSGTLKIFSCSISLSNTSFTLAETDSWWTSADPTAFAYWHFGSPRMGSSDAVPADQRHSQLQMERVFLHFLHPVFQCLWSGVNQRRSMARLISHSLELADLSLTRRGKGNLFTTRLNASWRSVASTLE